MIKFRDLQIKVESNAFIGDRIKMTKILNKEILIVKFKVEPSKFPDKGDGKRLVLQIKINDIEHIVFSGSMTLRNQILQVPTDKFPFISIIIQESESFKFT